MNEDTVIFLLIFGSK